jgi:hypothetical protein
MSDLKFKKAAETVPSKLEFDKLHARAILELAPSGVAAKALDIAPTMRCALNIQKRDEQ